MSAAATRRMISHPRTRLCGVLFATLVLAGCATAPTGPSTLVLPGTGKSFETFRFDDFECRNYSVNQAGAQASDQARQDSMVRGAVVGTVVGAIAGAAIDRSRGAGVGAGTGLILGTASGASGAAHDTYGTQRRYDHAYLQCMYAKGHRIPVDGRLSEAPAARPAPPAAAIAPAPAAGSQPVSPPEPPAGSPPPPPSGRVR